MSLSRLAVENIRNIIKQKNAVPANIAKECNESPRIPGSISKSYISAFVNDDKFDGVNLTTDKIETLAAYFNVAPWKILHPAGFNNEGKSNASDGLDIEVMQKSVKYVLDLAEKLRVNDTEFTSAAITLTYECYVSNGDESDLALKLIELAKSSN